MKNLTVLCSTYERLYKKKIHGDISKTQNVEYNEIKKKLSELIQSNQQVRTYVLENYANNYLTDDKTTNLFESVLFTEKLFSIINQLKGLISPYFTIGSVCGSIAHSPYFSVTKNSDIDFILITDSINISFSELEIFKNCKNDIQYIIKNFNKIKPVEFCYKFKFNQTEVSLHLTHIDFFKTLLNFSVCDNVIDLKTYRLQPREHGGKYLSRFSFDENEFMWDCTPIKEGKLITLLFPLYKIDNKRFVNGFLIDRYIISEYVFGDKLLYSTVKKKLLNTIKNRLKQELDNKTIAKGSIINIFSRHKIFSNKQITKLLKYEK